MRAVDIYGKRNWLCLQHKHKLKLTSIYWCVQKINWTFPKKILFDSLKIKKWILSFLNTKVRFVSESWDLCLSWYLANLHENFHSDLKCTFEANLLIIQTYCTFVQTGRSLEECKLDHFWIKITKEDVLHELALSPLNQMRSCPQQKNPEVHLLWASFLSISFFILHIQSYWFTLLANIGTARV